MQWVSLGRQQQRDWRPLLILELLDAVALKQGPELTVEEMVSMALVDVHGGRNGPVVLICRRDPLVLQICGRLSPLGSMVRGANQTVHGYSSNTLCSDDNTANTS